MNSTQTIPLEGTQKLRLDKESSMMHGINHILNVGTPLSIFEPYVTAYHQQIDFIKFGWGSALVDPEFQLKKHLCEQLGVRPVLGGTFFEYMLHHHDFSTFLKHIKSFGLQAIELSRGTIELENAVYASYIRDLSSDFFVMSEVGRKSNDPSHALDSRQWLEHCELSVAAGADLVILESRESGRAGFVSAKGVVDSTLLDSIEASIPLERLLFEAPIKSVQTFLLKRYGPSVNLGNVSLTDVLALQTLRMGLRSDTLLDGLPLF